MTPGPCALCGINPARGLASITDPDGDEWWLCHPDDGRDCYDCYSLWTVFGYRPSERVRRWLNGWPS